MVINIQDLYPFRPAALRYVNCWFRRTI